MSNSVWSHRWQPTRLPCPWDSPGKSTGVSCHCLLQCMKVKSESEVTQSCLTLSDPMDHSLPGSSVHGIFQARVLEWGAIAFSASQVHMEYSTGQTTSWVTNQISVNLRKQIISSVFSDHNAVRLGINYRGKNVRNTNTWRLNNTLLNNQQVNEEIKGKTKIF